MGRRRKEKGRRTGSPEGQSQVPSQSITVSHRVPCHKLAGKVSMQLLFVLLSGPSSVQSGAMA